jgi:hypothetical protein
MASAMPQNSKFDSGPAGKSFRVAQRFQRCDKSDLADSGPAGN